MKLTWPSTSRAEDAAVLALSDLAVAAGDQEYRVIGGNMTTFHGSRHTPRLPARATSDADAGIESNAAAATNLTTSLADLGYRQVDGSRFTRDQDGLTLVIDLLVPDSHAEEHNIELGPLSADAAPGLTIALAREATWVDVSVVLTSQQSVDLRLPLPDIAIAVVLKTLAWSKRLEDKDAIDVYRLLDVWDQDTNENRAIPLKKSKTVMRAAEVLQRFFLPPASKALLLPAQDQKFARSLTANFLNWVTKP